MQFSNSKPQKLIIFVSVSCTTKQITVVCLEPQKLNLELPSSPDFRLHIGKVKAFLKKEKIFVIKNKIVSYSANF